MCLCAAVVLQRVVDGSAVVAAAPARLDFVCDQAKHLLRAQDFQVPLVQLATACAKWSPKMQSRSDEHQRPRSTRWRWYLTLVLRLLPSSPTWMYASAERIQVVAACQRLPLQVAVQHHHALPSWIRRRGLGPFQTARGVSAGLCFQPTRRLPIPILPLLTSTTPLLATWK